MINGLGARLELLDPFLAALDPAVGVIRFNVPGIGGSPAPLVPYHFTGLCQTIARMLTVLGHDRADVLGLSWGGGVAQHFAAVQPDRCRRLVLASTATGALMVPARPSVLLRLLSPVPDAGPRPKVRRRRSGTSTSSPPGPAGRACRSCRCCASRRSSWPATTTR